MSTVIGESKTDERDKRAAQERLFVHDVDAPGVFHVYSTDGRKHVVDGRDGRCTCEDYQYRESYCKHQRRVDMVRGKRQIPTVPKIDPMLLDRLKSIS